MPVERLRHRRLEMDRAFPVANVIASRDAQDEVLAHCTTPAERKSAHVLATALSARAAVIVTDATFCLTEVMSKVWHDTAVFRPTPGAWSCSTGTRRRSWRAGAPIARASPRGNNSTPDGRRTPGSRCYGGHGSGWGDGRTSVRSTGTSSERRFVFRISAPGPG